MERVRWLIQGAVGGVLLLEGGRYMYYFYVRRTVTVVDSRPATTTSSTSCRIHGASSSTITIRQHQQVRERSQSYSSLVTKVQSSQPYEHNNISSVSPILPLVIINPNPNLEIAFDTRTKNPCYVLEKVSALASNKRNSIDDDNKKKSNAIKASEARVGKDFYEEKSLLPYHRSRNSYYKHTGYDRGHLAPVADFTACDNADEIIHDTFNLCNVSPQMPNFNRNEWANFERFVRDLVQEELGKLNNAAKASSGESEYQAYIVTGPVFLPSNVLRSSSSTDRQKGKMIFQYSYSGIGTPPYIVSVPTHFFKVIAIVNKSENIVTKVAAFVLPHEEYTGENNSSIMLYSYLVTMTELEAVTGLEFFPDMFGESMLLSSSSENEMSAALPLRKHFVDALTRDLQENLRVGERALTSLQDAAAAGNGTSPLSVSKHQRSNIKKQFYDSKEDPIYHLCQGHKCNINLRNGKRLDA